MNGLNVFQVAESIQGCVSKLIFGHVCLNWVRKRIKSIHQSTQNFHFEFVCVN